MAFEQVLHAIAMIAAAPAIIITMRVAVRWLLDRIYPNQKITVTYKNKDGEKIQFTAEVDDETFINLLDEILEKKKTEGHHV